MARGSCSTARGRLVDGNAARWLRKFEEHGYLRSVRSSGESTAAWARRHPLPTSGAVPVRTPIGATVAG